MCAIKPCQSLEVFPLFVLLLCCSETEGCFVLHETYDPVNTWLLLQCELDRGSLSEIQQKVFFEGGEGGGVVSQCKCFPVGFCLDDTRFNKLTRGQPLDQSQSFLSCFPLLSSFRRLFFPHLLQETGTWLAKTASFSIQTSSRSNCFVLHSRHYILRQAWARGYQSSGTRYVL